MLTTIKGIYKDGLIKPLEEVNVKDTREVIITFLDKAKKDDKLKFLSSAGSWKDIDTESLKKHIYENRKISNRKEIKL